MTNEYDPTVYTNDEWMRSLDYTDEWNINAIRAVMSILGVPQTFLDIGCGNGRLAEYMYRHLGEWAIDTLSMGIELYNPTGDKFIVVHDLREPLDLGIQFDMVACWEVGEHLPEESADVLCQTIARHTLDHLVFTSAHPGQGGDYHVNEQPQEYWRDKLTGLGLTYLSDETDEVRYAWTQCTGPCWWLPANVQVFKRL